MENMKLSAIFVALASAGLMTGCIGGSSDSGSTGGTTQPEIGEARASVAVTQQNSPEVVKVVASNVHTNLDIFDDIADIASVSQGDQRGKFFDGITHYLKDLKGYSGLDRVNASSTETESCDGGGKLTVSYQETGDWDKGSETGYVDFDQCKDSYTGLTIDGRLSFEGGWDDTKSPAIENYTIDFSDLSYVGNLSDETITVKMNGRIVEYCEFTNSYADSYCKTETQGIELKTNDISFAVYDAVWKEWYKDFPASDEWSSEEEFSYTLDTFELEGSVKVTTPVRLGFDGYGYYAPKIGSVKVVGLGNTSTTATFSANSVKIEVDSDGDGKADCVQDNLSLYELEEGSWSCTE